MNNKAVNTQAVSEDRRKLLFGATALAAATGLGLTTQSHAASNKMHAHEHHMHHEVPAARQKIIDTSLHCVKQGQACVQHCLDMFKMKDTSMAECADSVQEMLATCTAISQLASYDSRHLKAFAKVCVKVCEDCKEACDEHADTHAVCKDCSDSCKDCIKSCEDYVS